MIDELNNSAKSKFNIQNKQDLEKFLNSIDCQQINQCSLLQIFNENIERQNYDDVKNTKLQYKGILQKDNSVEYEIYLQKLLFENEFFILLTIDYISQEKKIQQLQQINNYKDELLAKVAHDIRNPLQSMNYLISDTAEHFIQNSKKQIDQNFKLMKSNSNYILFLVNDILNYCQFKENKLKFNMENFQLYYLLEEIYNILQALANLKQINIIINFQLNLNFIIKSDKNRLSQVLFNLVSNAIKFSTKGSQIVIQAKSHKEGVIKILVRDSGSGIPENIKQKLSQPFQTFGTSTNSNLEGIGLGLVISKEIIQVLGPNENFKIKSEVNIGTTFSFKLFTNSKEIIQEDQEDYIDENSLIIQSPKIFDLTNSFQQNYTFLLVDDNLFNLEVIKRQFLMIFKTCTLLQAHDGQEAVETFKENNILNSKNPIKLIFMDCQMPILDGFQATKKIKNYIKNESFINTIILGNSGFVTDFEQQKAKDAGMDKLVSKCIQLPQLTILLNNLIIDKN